MLESTYFDNHYLYPDIYQMTDIKTEKKEKTDIKSEKKESKEVPFSKLIGLDYEDVVKIIIDHEITGRIELGRLTDAKVADLLLPQVISSLVPSSWEFGKEEANNLIILCENAKNRKDSETRSIILSYLDTILKIAFVSYDKGTKKLVLQTLWMGFRLALRGKNEWNQKKQEIIYPTSSNFSYRDEIANFLIDKPAYFWYSILHMFGFTVISDFEDLLVEPDHSSKYKKDGAKTVTLMDLSGDQFSFSL